MCGEVFNDHYRKFTAEYASESISKFIIIIIIINVFNKNCQNAVSYNVWCSYDKNIVAYFLEPLYV